MAADSDTLNRLRRALIWTLVAGLFGTGAELLLLGHFEGLTQPIPLALIALGLAAASWHVGARSALSRRGLQGAMVLCVAGGLLGVALHYRGNLEFELEMYPSMAGAELVQKVATGATPVLAPGAMALLGAVGLLSTWREGR